MVGTDRWTDDQKRLVWNFKKTGKTPDETVEALKRQFPKPSGVAKPWAVGAVKYMLAKLKKEPGSVDAGSDGQSPSLNNFATSKAQHDACRVSKAMPKVHGHKNSSAANQEAYRQYGAAEAMKVIAAGGNSIHATLHHPTPINSLASAPTSSPATMLNSAQYTNKQGSVRQTGANEYTINDDDDSPKMNQASIPPQYSPVQPPLSSSNIALMGPGQPQFPYVDPATWARLQQDLIRNGQQPRNITGINQTAGYGETSHATNIHGTMQLIRTPNIQHAGFGNTSGVGLRQGPLGMPRGEAGSQLLRKFRPTHTQGQRPPAQGLLYQNVSRVNSSNGSANPSMSNDRNGFQDIPCLYNLNTTNEELAMTLEEYANTPNSLPSNQYAPTDSNLGQVPQYQISEYQISNSAQRTQRMNVPQSFPAHSTSFLAQPQTMYNNHQQRAPSNVQNPRQGSMSRDEAVRFVNHAGFEVTQPQGGLQMQHLKRTPGGMNQQIQPDTTHLQSHLRVQRHISPMNDNQVSVEEQGLAQPVNSQMSVSSGINQPPRTDTASSQAYHPAQRLVTPMDGHQANMQTPRNAQSFGGRQQASQHNQCMSQMQTKHMTQSRELYGQQLQDLLFRQQQNAGGDAKGSVSMAHAIKLPRQMQFPNNSQPQVRSKSDNTAAFGREPNTGGSSIDAHNFDQASAMGPPGTPAPLSSSTLRPQTAGSTKTDPRNFNQGSAKSGQISTLTPASYQPSVDMSRDNSAPAPVNRYPHDHIQGVNSANAPVHQIPTLGISNPDNTSANGGHPRQTRPGNTTGDKTGGSSCQVPQGTPNGNPSNGVPPLIQKSDSSSSPTDPSTTHKSSPTYGSPVIPSTTPLACANNVIPGPVTFELYNPTFTKLNVSMMQTGWNVKWRIQDAPPEAPLLTFQRPGPQPLVVKIFNPTFLNDLELPAGDPNEPFHEIHDEPNASAFATEAMTPTNAQPNKPAMSIDLEEIDHVAGMMHEDPPQNGVEITFPDMWKSSTSTSPPDVVSNGKAGSSFATPPTSSQPDFTPQLASTAQPATVASSLIAQPVPRVSPPKVMAEISEVEPPPTNRPQGPATRGSFPKTDAALPDVAVSTPQGVQLIGCSKQAGHITRDASGSVDSVPTPADKPTTRASSAVLSQTGSAKMPCVNTSGTNMPAAESYHSSPTEVLPRALSPQLLPVLKLHSNGRYSKRKREDSYVLPDAEQPGKRRKLTNPSGPQRNISADNSESTKEGILKHDSNNTQSSRDFAALSSTASPALNLVDESRSQEVVDAANDVDESDWPEVRGDPRWRLYSKPTMTSDEIFEETWRILEEEDKQKREKRRLRNSSDPDHICYIGCKAGACDCMTCWEKEWVDFEDLDAWKEPELPFIMDEDNMWKPGEKAYVASLGHKADGPPLEEPAKKQPKLPKID